MKLHTGREKATPLGCEKYLGGGLFAHFYLPSFSWCKVAPFGVKSPYILCARTFLVKFQPILAPKGQILG